jgi:quercetin dioxygenase-like cupin family protein
MSDTFIDERGVIQDLLTEPIDAVTRIRTVKGAVRGNHVHRRTTQWTYVLTGSLLVASGDSETIAGPGDMLVDEPGTPHAWKALEDTDCLVFTQGPRSGADYESDTHRLEVPLIEPESVLDGDWDTLARIEHEDWRLQDDRAP